MSEQTVLNSPVEYIDTDKNIYKASLETTDKENNELRLQVEELKRALIEARNSEKPMMRAFIACDPPEFTESNSNHENGWDMNANEMLHGWLETMKSNSFIYQFILDRNYRFSTNLSLLSIVSSSALSIFSGFKLWIDNDQVFRSASDITMMISNFLVAAITTASKRYIDDQRNEKIRLFVEECDKFSAIILSTFSVTPHFRPNAEDFFKKHKETYTKIMVNMPTASIRELELAKRQYQKFKTVSNQNI